MNEVIKSVVVTVEEPKQDVEKVVTVNEMENQKEEKPTNSKKSETAKKATKKVDEIELNEDEKLARDRLRLLTKITKEPEKSMEIMQEYIDTHDLFESLYDDVEECRLSQDKYIRVPQPFSVRDLIRMYRDKNLIIPDFQRLFVWSEEQQENLIYSILHNLSCSCMVMATDCTGNYYLLDGMQRLNTFLKAANNPVYADKKNDILDYRITVDVLHNLNIEDMKIMFKYLNSGIALALSYKELSKMDEKIVNDVQVVTNPQFFESIEYKNRTFSTQGQHINIALNAILAYSSGEYFIGERDNKMSYFINYFNNSANHESVKEACPKAIELLNRIPQIYDEMLKMDSSQSMQKRIKRSCNSNFWSVMVYIMHDEEWVKNEYIINVINDIFKNGRAIEAYAQTVRNSSNIAKNNIARREYLLELLKQEYETWKKNTPISIQEGDQWSE